MTTRSEHVEWCKSRAREYLAMNDLQNAIASMMSDMGKRDDTKIDPHLAMIGMLAVMQSNAKDASSFIEGFN